MEIMETKTILIVEDNPANLKLTRDILVFRQYNVIEAKDGKTAIEKINSLMRKIDLILMDLRLPDIHGLDIIRKIKNSDDTKKIPVIVVSAHAMESDIKTCMDAGCADYITKPINIQDFISRIAAILESPNI